MVLFVNSFAPLLAVVFDEIRCFGGAGAVPGSVEAMASQWIRWSGSPKLRALMSMASEFLSIWRSHDDYIGLPDEDYDVVCYHKVFSRPRRALFLLTSVQGIKPVALDSFADVMEQFSGEEDEVEQMYKQFYAMALDSVCEIMAATCLEFLHLRPLAILILRTLLGKHFLILNRVFFIQQPH